MFNKSHYIIKSETPVKIDPLYNYFEKYVDLLESHCHACILDLQFSTAEDKDNWLLHDKFIAHIATMEQDRKHF